MKSEFRNDATMEEKANVLKNDRANASTLHQFASSETGEVGGRWAKPTQVVGTGAPEYPRLPENSPWAQDDLLGPEPTLGYDINAVEPIEDRALVADGRPEHIASVDVREGSGPTQIEIEEVGAAAAPASASDVLPPSDALAVEPLTVPSGDEIKADPILGSSPSIPERRRKP
jgi:hypothetical protein